MASCAGIGGLGTPERVRFGAQLGSFAVTLSFIHCLIEFLCSSEKWPKSSLNICILQKAKRNERNAKFYCYFLLFQLSLPAPVISSLTFRQGEDPAVSAADLEKRVTSLRKV